MKDEDDVTSLYEPSSDGDEFFVDEIDGEVEEIFFVSVAYIQLLAFPEEFDSTPQIVAKTESLAEQRLPFSYEAYESIGENMPYHAETVTDLFPFALRVLSLEVQDADERPYILQLALSLQRGQRHLTEFCSLFSERCFRSY